MPDYYNEKKIAKIEAQLSGQIAGFLLKQKRRIINAITGGIVINWIEENDALYKEIASTLMDIATNRAIETSLILPGGVDIAVLNKHAVEWAKTYGFDLVKGINESSAGVIRSAVSSYVSTPGMTRQDLEDMLVNTFGPVRAESIGVTETTRALHEGEKIVGDEFRRMGITMVDIWETRNDDLVCPICGPRHKKEFEPGWEQPAHPRCRCRTFHKLKR